jgi:hypothetical protein
LTGRHESPLPQGDDRAGEENVEADHIEKKALDLLNFVNIDEERTVAGSTSGAGLS